MASKNLEFKMGNNPQPTVNATVTASINSSNTVTFHVSWKLAEMGGYDYWGYGVRIQSRTGKYSSSSGAYSYSDWTNKANPVTESSTRWSAKTGSFSVTVASCTATTNAQIQLRLVKQDGSGAGTAATFTPDIVAVTLKAGTGIASVTKSPNQSYHIEGDSITATCTLASKTGYQTAWKNWTSSNTSATANSTSRTYQFKASDAESVILTANATQTANTGTIYYHPNGGAAKTGYPLSTSGSYSGFSQTTTSFNYTSTSANICNVSTLFTRSGYHCASTAQAWRVNSATATTYLNQDSQNLSSYVSSKTGAVIKAYANWAINTGTIYFYPNGGQAVANHPLLTSGNYKGASSATVTFDYDDTAINIWNVSSLFSRTGYHVPSDAQAWRLGSTTATTYINQATQNMRSYLTSQTGVVLKCYANWVANTYTVKYDGNGSSGGSTSNSTHTYNEAKNLTSNGYTRTGYKFLGWNTSASATSAKYTDKQSVKNLSTAQNGTVTLYAIWEKQEFSIIFDNQNGDLASTGIATYGLPLPTLEKIPVREGYDFQGYYAQANGTGTQFYDRNGIGSISTISQDGVILYAHWTKRKIRIEYDGHISDIYNPDRWQYPNGTMTPHEETWGEPFQLKKNTYSLSGYTFAGWRISPDAQQKEYDDQDIITIPEENKTISKLILYAVWEPNQHKIQFDGKTESIAILYGNDLPNVEPPLKRDGYNFIGYYYNGVQYYNSQGFPVRKMDVDEDITFVEIWDPIIYHLRFTADEDADGQMCVVTVTYDQFYTLPDCAFKKANYTCIGWNINGTLYSIGETVSNLTTISGFEINVQAVFYPNHFAYHADNDKNMHCHYFYYCRDVEKGWEKCFVYFAKPNEDGYSWILTGK